MQEEYRGKLQRLLLGFLLVFIAMLVASLYVFEKMEMWPVWAVYGTASSLAFIKFYLDLKQITRTLRQQTTVTFVLFFLSALAYVFVASYIGTLPLWPGLLGAVVIAATLTLVYDAIYNRRK